MWPYKQKRSTLDFVIRLEIFIQGKRSLKYVAAKRKQISISGGGDIWRGPGTANSKLTASCHQRPGPNSLPAFYFYSSSSTWTWLQCVCFADSALNRFSIGFPSGPAAKCIGAVFPPTHRHFRHCLESCDLLQERKYLRCIEFPSAGTKRYWCAVFYVLPTSKAATFFERTVSLKKRCWWWSKIKRSSF